MALDRFLFAPVLLAVAVYTTPPRRAEPPASQVPVPAPAAPGSLTTVSAHALAPVRPLRVGPSHPGSVR
jgi:hypothetical protein